MRRGAIVPALVLILVGVYLLLPRLGVGIPGWDVIWPVFPLAAGLVFLGRYVFDQQRDPGQVFIGTAATLVGLAFFFVTLGPLEYRNLRTWWPVFVLIGSVAFLAQWTLPTCLVFAAFGHFGGWDTVLFALLLTVTGGVLDLGQAF